MPQQHLQQLPHLQNKHEAHMKSAVLAALPLMFVITACGGGAESTSSDTVGQTAAPEPVAAVAKTGEDVFKKCMACHTVTPEGRNGIGPGLHGITGRAVASAPGFTYSSGLKAKGGVWDEANLDAFLTAPAKWAPGTKMMFAGINDAADRKALIDYLATLK
jgi:cytochrome c